VKLELVPEFFMEGGVVVEEGRPDAVLLRPQHERTRAFLRRLIER
jgi:ABC-type polar amino acid transport system ATPase subunit